MGFPYYIVEQAWERQGGRCAYCGKKLSWDNRGRDDAWGAWEPHHKKPLEYGGTDYLRNCAILCINVDNCHLYCGHGGDFRQRIVLYDDELPYLIVVFQRKLYNKYTRIVIPAKAGI
ncbi:MAG: HNH endonuclease [Chloroflexi bacterium]|nr:HNH endonuclease [Chloroflexota bacterium]